MSERVYWDDTEKTRLIDLVFVMQTNTPDRCLTELINNAQKQIPEGRRRKINNINVVPWLIEGVKRRHSELKANKSGMQPVVQQETPKVGDFSTESLIMEIIKRSQTDVMLEELILKASTEIIIRELIKRILGKSDQIDQMMKMFNRLASDIHIKLGIEHQHKENKPKPKAFIAGLKENQIAEIKRKFEHIVDLSFHESGRASISKAPNCKSFCMTKFLDHSTFHVLKSTGNLTEINGGVTELSTALSCWLIGELR